MVAPVPFESYEFHKRTGGAFDRGSPNLSTPSWDQHTYGVAGAHQYDRLAQAISLNEEAVLQSTSWGLFQLMGWHAAECGCETAVAFVEGMVDGGEIEHLRSAVAWMNAAGLLPYLKRGSWAEVARRYNGAGYAKNHYDTKLAAAFKAAGGR
ncbi:Protein of unknown function [Faunimonas pinastri]|uniref:N-acetylmuramidase domain-containing protein n=1 Tax=Faunimonas pinastri TaxID=1855383 RepID=A0A1H9JMJ9_9HYPH|nr:N-acetylmuramidase domain-containing protein [Faunimonas pinastri]SEQ88019.1 Protein of unknown function [Faunimonas pinastri]